MKSNHKFIRIGRRFTNHAYSATLIKFSPSRRSQITVGTGGSLQLHPSIPTDLQSETNSSELPGMKSNCKFVGIKRRSYKLRLASLLPVIHLNQALQPGIVSRTRIQIVFNTFDYSSPNRIFMDVFHSTFDHIWPTQFNSVIFMRPEL